MAKIKPGGRKKKSGIQFSSFISGARFFATSKFQSQPIFPFPFSSSSSFPFLSNLTGRLGRENKLIGWLVLLTPRAIGQFFKFLFSTWRKKRIDGIRRQEAKKDIVLPHHFCPIRGGERAPPFQYMSAEPKVSLSTFLFLFSSLPLSKIVISPPFFSFFEFLSPPRELLLPWRPPPSLPAPKMASRSKS